MKTIGIIGGMGPLATIDLYEKITFNTKAEKDQDHIHIIIDSFTHRKPISKCFFLIIDF